MLNRVSLEGEEQVEARKIETALSGFTLGMLVIYVPVETWTSLRYGLLSPFYIVDLIGMVLLFVGSIVSLRARPIPSPALLCAAYGWTAASAWRATFGRVLELRRGGELYYGSAELWAVSIGTVIALLAFAVLLYLVCVSSRLPASTSEKLR